MRLLTEISLDSTGALWMKTSAIEKYQEKFRILKRFFPIPLLGGILLFFRKSADETILEKNLRLHCDIHCE